MLLFQVVVSRFGRTLDVIFLGNGNVNAQMIRMGVAWHYKQYSDSVSMQQFEDYSRMGRFGLWSDPNSKAPGIGGMENGKR